MILANGNKYKVVSHTLGPERIPIYEVREEDMQYGSVYEREETERLDRERAEIKRKTPQITVYDAHDIICESCDAAEYVKGKDTWVDLICHEHFIKNPEKACKFFRTGGYTIPYITEFYETKNK